MNDNNRFKRLEVILSLSSIVIAICAMLLTYQQGNATKKHNQLSVTPLIVMEGGNEYKNKIFRIFFNNCGLGPAIIDQFKIHYHGDTYQPTVKNWAAVFEAAKIEWTNIDLYKATIVKPGDKVEIVAISYGNKDESVLKKLMDELELSIDYKDLYSRKFKTTLKNH